MLKLKQIYLSRFHPLSPPYESSQEDALDWFWAAHYQAEKKKGLSGAALQSFGVELKERIDRVACKKERIARRRHMVPDYLHRDWSLMEIYRLEERESGAALGERGRKFATFVEGLFDQWYQEETPPDDLIHVTCTGYVAPSGAQKLVSKKGWGKQTTVTHAYHMGCYASMPALRMARGFLKEAGKERADIVHTELCSLHCNPALHNADQLVSQSLFADGAIKYSLGLEPAPQSYQLGAIAEQVLPGSTETMTWDVVDWGFQMSLKKEIPVLIARALPEFAASLVGPSQWEKIRADALFAIHPGGPKILDYVQDILQLEDWQVEDSAAVLQERGNMSSATLPHIWQRMVHSPRFRERGSVISFAFGPGLTMCGTAMEMRCGG